MRALNRVAGLALLLAACAAPTGSPVEECDGTWRDVESVIVSPGGGQDGPIEIECVRQVDDNRVRIGFSMPAGPSCHRLGAVEIVESADAVSITLIATVDENPSAGACAEEPARTATEIDLQAPVDDRILLDGSADR